MEHLKYVTSSLKPLELHGLAVQKNIISQKSYSSTNNAPPLEGSDGFIEGRLQNGRYAPQRQKEKLSSVLEYDKIHSSDYSKSNKESN